MDINAEDTLEIQSSDHALESKRIQLQPIRTIIKDVVNANLEYVGYSMQSGADESANIFKLKRKQKTGSKTYVHWAGDYFDKAFIDRGDPGIFPAISPAYQTNRSLFFDGINDYATTPDHALLDFARLSAFSIGGWVKWFDGAANLLEKFTGGFGYTLSVDASGRVEFNFQGGGIGNRIRVREDTNTLLDQGWHFVMVTYDGSSAAAGLRVYVDGLETGRNVLNDTLTVDTVSAAAFVLGASSTGGAPRFLGFQTEWHVWTTVVTPAEMTEIVTSLGQIDLSVAGSVYASQASLSVRFRPDNITVFPSMPDDIGGLTSTLTNMTTNNVVAETPN